MSIPEAIFFKPSSLDGLLLSGARRLYRSAIFKGASGARERLPDAREDNRELTIQAHPSLLGNLSAIKPDAEIPGASPPPVLQLRLTRYSGGARKLDTKIAFLRDFERFIHKQHSNS